MICCLPECSIDLLVTLLQLALRASMELFDAYIDLLHAHVLSYASANCRLAYMLLHRGICTFGALLHKYLQANYCQLTRQMHLDLHLWEPMDISAQCRGHQAITNIAATESIEKTADL